VSFRDPNAARAGEYVTGLYFLEPLIYANVPAFLWLGYCGVLSARRAR
jgi:hypothetical protein